MKPATSDVAQRLVALKVLIVDDEPTMRQSHAFAIAGDRHQDDLRGQRRQFGPGSDPPLSPDVVIVDWEMPHPNGPEFVRTVRSPDTFPIPHVPIIMLTGHGERSRVVAAVNLGVNDFLVKPVSTKALLARLVSLIANPRRMVRIGDYYGPEPRRLSNLKPESEVAWV